jgi:hypothetical protein
MPKRIDANQTEIVKALRQCGCSVLILSAVGKGCPDLAVGYDGTTYLLEVKDGGKTPSKQKLTPDEEAWHAAWSGHVAIVNSVEAALRVVGLVE